MSTVSGTTRSTRTRTKLTEAQTLLRNLNQYISVLYYVTVPDLNDYIEDRRASFDDEYALDEEWQWLDQYCKDFFEYYYPGVPDQQPLSALDMPDFLAQTSNRGRSDCVVRALKLPTAARYFSRGDSEARFWLSVPADHREAVIEALLALDLQLNSLLPQSGPRDHSVLEPLFQELQQEGYVIGYIFPISGFHELTDEEKAVLRALFIKAYSVINPE